MAQRIGGMAANSGFYWNLGRWEMTMVPKQGGILPGDASQRYMKVPVIGLLFLAPMMGAAYAMFLPFIGFATLFTFLGQKALRAAGVGALGAAATMAQDWRPGESYLAGDKRKNDTRQNAANKE